LRRPSAFGRSVSTIANVTITQDANASSMNKDGVTIESVTIDSLNPNTMVKLTTADLPPGITVPPGFTLPQNVIGTMLGVTVLTNIGTFSGTVGLYGTNGPEALVAVQNIDVDGFTVNAGAAILSLGSQDLGSIDSSFTPAFTAAPCFAGGTRIATAEGQVAVQELRAGTLVMLADGSTAPVAWIGKRRGAGGGVAGVRGGACVRHGAPGAKLGNQINMAEASA
jgi:hypothetical protein